MFNHSNKLYLQQNQDSNNWDKELHILKELISIKPEKWMIIIVDKMAISLSLKINLTKVTSERDYFKTVSEWTDAKM